jgi:predicted branched-subunit amino acid permease
MEENKKDKYLFYFSAMLTFWFAWVLADFLGALVGASFPHIEKYGLDFAMVAAFIAIVVPQIKSQACCSPLSVPYPGYFWSYCPTR